MLFSAFHGFNTQIIIIKMCCTSCFSHTNSNITRILIYFACMLKETLLKGVRIHVFMLNDSSVSSPTAEQQRGLAYAQKSVCHAPSRLLISATSGTSGSSRDTSQPSISLNPWRSGCLRQLGKAVPVGKFRFRKSLLFFFILKSIRHKGRLWVSTSARWMFSSYDLPQVPFNTPENGYYLEVCAVN